MKRGLETLISLKKLPCDFSVQIVIARPDITFE